MSVDLDKASGLHDESDDGFRDTITVKGMFRVQIEDGPTGEIVGDSGWIKNQITNIGFNNYMINSFASQANSSYISYVALGTGAAPASNDTTQGGELASRTTLSVVTATNKAVQFQATFTSAQSFLAGASTIQNIGLWRSSTLGSLFAGNTYGTSSCATNQNVNVSYTITFT